MKYTASLGLYLPYHPPINSKRKAYSQSNPDKHILEINGTSHIKEFDCLVYCLHDINTDFLDFFATNISLVQKG